MITHNHDRTHPRGTNATKTEAVTGSDSTKMVDVASAKQAFSSWLRDSMGRFHETVQPSLNLFCPNHTSDVAPIGTFTRATTATRLGISGYIESVLSGALRQEWDLSGNLLGWLIEESRTNLQTNSNDFSQWTQSATTVTINSIASPDGTVNADKLCEDTTTGQHSLSGISCTAGSVVITASIFAKAGERTSLGILISDNTSAVIGASFDLTTGTAVVTASPSPWSNISVSMKDYGNGWYRCIFTATKGQGTTCLAVLNPLVGGTNNYAGTLGSGLYLFGAQIEIGAFPTSYIPTTTAATTRAADVWTISVADFPFNPNEGTIFSAVNLLDNKYAVMLSDGTTTNAIILGSGIRVVSGGVEQANNLSTPTLNTTHKLIGSYKLNDFSAAIDGTLKTPDTSGTVPMVSSFGIMENSAGIPTCGHVKHIAYFPRRLSDFTLQAITL